MLTKSYHSFSPSSKREMSFELDHEFDDADATIFQTDEYTCFQQNACPSNTNTYSPYRQLSFVHQGKSPLYLPQRHHSYTAKSSSWVQSYTRSLTFLPELVNASDHMHSETQQYEYFLPPNNVNDESRSHSVDEEDVECIPQEEGSTLAQTCFNLLNLLVGIGFLSLPYALMQSGWLYGALILIGSAFLTFYTGLLIWMCMNACGAKNYGDLAEACFGKQSRRWVSLIFILELYITCAAFIVLISDSLYIIFPQIPLPYLRILASIFAFAFLCIQKLEYLSYASLAGIFASINLIIAVLLNGFLTSTTPGSILHPAKTNLMPENIICVPLTFGLVMAGFAGHAVLPSICQDMKKKSDYPLALLISFGLAFVLYSLIGVSGYLMYGNQCLEEITKNLVGPESYPIMNTINFITTCFIAFIPLPKYALTMNPVALAVDDYMLRIMGASDLDVSLDKSGSLRWMRVFNRLILVLGTCLIPFMIPHFDMILCLLGTSFASLVSLVLPILFYLNLHSPRSIWVWINKSIVALCILLSILSTIVLFIPHTRQPRP